MEPRLFVGGITGPASRFDTGIGRFANFRSAKIGIQPFSIRVFVCMIDEAIVFSLLFGHGTPQRHRKTVLSGGKAKKPCKFPHCSTAGRQRLRNESVSGGCRLSRDRCVFEYCCRPVFVCIGTATAHHVAEEPERQQRAEESASRGGNRVCEQWRRCKSSSIFRVPVVPGLTPAITIAISQRVYFRTWWWSVSSGHYVTFSLVIVNSTSIPVAYDNSRVKQP